MWGRPIHKPSTIQPISNAACLEHPALRARGVSLKAGAPRAPCLALPGDCSEGHLMPMMRCLALLVCFGRLLPDGPGAPTVLLKQLVLNKRRKH